MYDKFCPDDVENESHFIFYCNKYRDIRNKFIIADINNINISNPTNTILTAKILNPQSYSNAVHLISYLKHALELRKS